MFLKKISFSVLLFLFASSVSHGEITLTFVGDVMIGSDYPDINYLPPDKGKNVFEGVKDILQNSDIAFANIEGSIADQETEPRKKGNSKTYSFRMPPYMAKRLAEAGFSVAALANNHSRDFGEKGFIQTVKYLKEAGITVVGNNKGRPAYVEIGDKTIGFLAFYYFPAYHDSIQNIKSAKKLIADTKANCDFLVLSFHGGAEGPQEYSVPKATENFYGENRGDVYKFARSAAESGADIIIGHGPHVLRAMEIYAGAFIAYSMGNFAGYRQFNISGNSGISGILQITISEDMEITAAKVVPVKLRNGGVPIVDKAKTAITKLNEYAGKDFPKTGVLFDKDGNANLMENRTGGEE